MSKPQTVVGHYRGTGGVVNVQLGFVPDHVEILNADGDEVFTAFPKRRAIAFTSGGTREVKAGHTIKGNTSKSKALILAVFLASGSWAAGDAAGILVIDAETETAAFGSETAIIDDQLGTDDLTVAASTALGSLITTAAAASTAVTAYKGTDGANNSGFTVAAGASESGKLYAYRATRNEA